MRPTEIRKEAIKKVIKKLGPGFLDDPTFNESGVAQEVINDMEAEIRKELDPKKPSVPSTQPDDWQVGDDASLLRSLGVRERDELCLKLLNYDAAGEAVSETQLSMSPMAKSPRSTDLTNWIELGISA